MKQPWQKQLKNEDSDRFNFNLLPLSWAAVQKRLQFVQHGRLWWQSNFDFLPNRRTRHCQNSFEAKRRCQDQRHCRKNTVASRIQKLKGIARYFSQKYLTPRNNLILISDYSIHFNNFVYLIVAIKMLHVSELSYYLILALITPIQRKMVIIFCNRDNIFETKDNLRCLWINYEWNKNNIKL